MPKSKWIRALLAGAMVAGLSAGCKATDLSFPPPAPPPDCRGTHTTLQYVFHRHHPTHTGILGSVVLRCIKLPEQYSMTISLEYSKDGQTDWESVTTSEAVREFGKAKPPVLGKSYYLHSFAVCLDGTTVYWRLTQIWGGKSSSGHPFPTESANLPETGGWQVTCGSQHEAYHLNSP